MDPVDPKRRGRRLFGGRRRHEHAAEAEMDEPTTTAVPDAPASGGPPNLAPTPGPDELAAPTAAVETVTEPDPTAELEREPQAEPSNDPVVVEDEPTIVSDPPPAFDAGADATT